MEKFDLQSLSEEQVVLNLQALKNSEGWKTFVALLELNYVSKLENKLLNHEYTELNERSVDMKILKEVKKILLSPEDFISLLKDEEVMTFDPYEQF